MRERKATENINPDAEKQNPRESIMDVLVFGADQQAQIEISAEVELIKERFTVWDLIFLLFFFSKNLWRF